MITIDTLRKNLYQDLMNEETNATVSDYISHVETIVSVDVTLEEALRTLRKKQIDQKIIYFYAVDSHGKLKGVISARQLLLSDPKKMVSEVMQEKVARLKVGQTVKEALELFDRHPLLSLPVVDVEGKLLGAIDVQTITKESVDLADMHNRLAVFQMIGLTLEEGKKIPVTRSYRLRMPWILCNIFSGLVCAVVSRLYEKTLSQMLILAFFIPLVLTLSESMSMLSMTQSFQFLRRPRINWKTLIAKGAREWQVAILLAASSGFFVGGISLFWGEGIEVASLIGFGIFLSSGLSTLFAIVLPFILFRMKLDPKVAAGPVVLMIADILTMGIYLTLATGWLLLVGS